MIDKETLLARREDAFQEVELPTLGGTVKVRGLTRTEALRLQGKPMDVAEQERKLLALAMVDPVMTEDDVRQWQRVAPAGELEPIGQAIRELSGMVSTAVKEEMATFHD